MQSKKRTSADGTADTSSAKSSSVVHHSATSCSLLQAGSALAVSLYAWNVLL